MRKSCFKRRKTSLLNYVKIVKRFEDVNELVDGVPNMWGCLKDGDLKACNEVCGKNSGCRHKGSSLWWNEGVEEAMSRMKDAHKVMCRNNSEENTRNYESMQDKAIRETHEDALIVLTNCPSWMFRLVNELKIIGKKLKEEVIESFVSVRRKLVNSGRIMNEENDWDHNVEGVAVEGTVVCVSKEEVVQALMSGEAMDRQTVYHWSWLLFVEK